MISLQKIRDLNLNTTTGSTHLSAASGIAIVGDNFYVVADDENHLGVFSLSGNESGKIIKVFAGDLPDEKAARKKLKPDLETITYLPAMDKFPHGALLALGSGSKENRQQGIILAFEKNDTLDNSLEVINLPLSINLASLYTELRQHFVDLNIEGAFIANNELVLMQRGNQTQPECALIFCPLAQFLQLLKTDEVDFSKELRLIKIILPKANEVPLCFTDGTLLPNGNILFTAVAEDTRDSYNDGENVGSAIGVMQIDGQLICFELLEHPDKIEGIAILNDKDALTVLVVTDADNAAIPATLFKVLESNELIQNL